MKKFFKSSSGDITRIASVYLSKICFNRSSWGPDEER